MKKLWLIPVIASGMMAFATGRLSYLVNSPVVGVWKNVNKTQSIRMVKFFPNGLMNIADSTDNWVTSYKLDSDSADIHGQINWHSTDVPFTARIQNSKLMELTLNYMGQERVIYLIKTKDIKSGAVLLNSKP
jgi:hypothetical protein